MIHPFNRVLLLTCSDFRRLDQARHTLDGAGIEYTVHPAPSTAFAGPNLPQIGTGTLSARAAARAQYKLYVKRDDFALSKSLL